jgi:diacylglycerol O-acyltransferase / wax synthase
MERAIALRAEDRAILALEGPTIAGHTCKVVVVAEADPDVDALRAEIAARIVAAPELTWRLGGSDREPAWIPDSDFAVRNHVTACAVPAPLDFSDLSVEVARLFEERLDRRRPLWHMDVIPLRSGFALAWRVHHALADGATSMRFAREVLWDEPRSRAPHVRSGHPAGEAPPRRRLGGFVERELSRSRARSPFDGRIGTRREIAFARVALEPLHETAKAVCDATVNDAVLAVVAGALRRWFVAHHGSLGALRVKVPVSLHHEDDEDGNRDSFFCVAVPLNEPDPLARLEAVHAETALRKTEHDAETMDALLRGVGKISPRLRAFANRLQASPRSFALNVSNVPGPRAPVSVLGAPVAAIYSIAELRERHALRIAVVSVAGQLCFGFCADPEILDDVQSIADGVEAETGMLTALAS